MKYDNTNLPENIRAFLEEIINDPCVFGRDN